MIYSKEVFSQAETEINRRRIEALAIYEKRQEEIENVAPEIASIHRQLVNTSVELSKAIMNKNCNIKDAIEKIKEENLKSQKIIKVLLKDFDYPEDYLDIHYTCNKCNDTGYVQGIRCECFNELLKKYSVKEINRNSNIKLEDFNNFNIEFYPDEIDDITGANPRLEMTANFNLCKQYVNEFSDNSPSLFFIGKTGLGKTFLSSAIAKELLQKGYNVAFDSIQNFLRAIENEHFGRVQYTDTLQTLISADLVILDDLGSEFNSPFYSSALYNIINSRLNKELPTIISTNLSLSELQSKYDDRIISRITGMYTILNFIGKDIRYINAMNK